MNESDFYLSKPVRAARTAAVLTCWTIWLIGLALTFFLHRTVIAPIIGATCFFLGFVPYIVSLKRIEPWIMKRLAQKHAERYPG